MDTSSTAINVDQSVYVIKSKMFYCMHLSVSKHAIDFLMLNRSYLYVMLTELISQLLMSTEISKIIYMCIATAVNKTS